ncbi:MAG: citrate lyase holo-[Bacteroidales bacterium]|nr:citrate lyase holo-[acyl-carrier protein] synthase [Bacteroidales bacterium]
MTLEEILESREARVRRQRELLEANPGLSLLCLTVQLPGPVKRNKSSLVIAEAGVKAVREAYTVEIEELRDLETGYEGFFLVPMSPFDAKRLACHLEDTHPLGRLMDLDVIVTITSKSSSTPLHPRGGLRGVPLKLPASLRSESLESESEQTSLSGGREVPGRTFTRIGREAQGVRGLPAAKYSPAPLGREDLGLEPRKCLLCGNEVRHCMRAKSHTTEELLAKIDQMVDIYLKS